MTYLNHLKNGLLLLGSCWLMAGDTTAPGAEFFGAPRNFDRDHFPSPGPNNEECYDQPDGQLLLDKLRRVVLIDKSSNKKDKEFRSDGEIEYVNISLNRFEIQDMTKMLNKRYLGKPLYPKTLQSIRQDILKNYRDAGRPFVLVLFHDNHQQDITDGTLRIYIIESKLGDIRVSGNHYYDTSRYLDKLHLDAGQPILMDELLCDLEWINDSMKFQRALAQFSPGERQYTTDVDIIVEDHKPWRIYLGTDNTGIQATDYERVFVGLNWGNFFNTDQVISYQYMASPDFNKVQIHTLRWEIPLPWRNTLVFFGGYSSVNGTFNGLPTSFLSGKNWQLSSRYEVPICPVGSWKQKASTGLDFKSMNNEVNFNSLESSQHFVNIFQFVGEYNTNFRLCDQYFDIGAEFFLSPGDLIGDQTTALYQELRPGANSTYVYGRANLNYLLTLPKEWTFDFKTRIQLASTNLLPSEQYGLGGVNSVRGYVERAVNVDNALILNTEFVSPKISLIDYWHNRTGGKDRFWGLFFLDFAAGSNNVQVFNYETVSTTLLGVGPGLRYSYADRFHVRLDWGTRLIYQSSSPGASRVYFSVVTSY